MIALFRMCVKLFQSEFLLLQVKGPQEALHQSAFLEPRPDPRVYEAHAYIKKQWMNYKSYMWLQTLRTFF